MALGDQFRQYRKLLTRYLALQAWRVIWMAALLPVACSPPLPSCSRA
jgi:hypothetical protein